MDFGDILSRTQREFGDENEIQIETDDVLRWANDAQLEIARKTECIVRETTFTSSAGIEAYPLPADFMKIKDCFYNGVLMHPIALSSLDSMAPDRKTSTTPFAYPFWYRVRSKQLLVWPLPQDTGKTFDLEYVARPVLFTGTNSTSELPEQFVPEIVTYCLARAYALDGNFGASQARGQEFDQRTSQFMSEGNWAQGDTYPLIETPYADWSDY